MVRVIDKIIIIKISFPDCIARLILKETKFKICNCFSPNCLPVGRFAGIGSKITLPPCIRKATNQFPATTDHNNTQQLVNFLEVMT